MAEGVGGIRNAGGQDRQSIRAAPRGLPLFFPVRKNLRRAEKLLRNMSVVAEIQSAIAIIRKHASGTRGGLEQLAHGDADVYAARPGSGQASYFRRYSPGTILDVLGDTDYEFPASGIDAGRYVTVLQAELRAIASRLVMPEFMLTSDASNANYASTMVAEGPAMRMFDRMQQDMIEDDLGVMEHVLESAVQGGRLPATTLALVEVRAVPPTLAVRDRLQEAQADQILVRNGAMSVETMAMRNGLSPEHEQQLIARRAAVREHNFNPDEPRDEKGRWTTGGSGNSDRLRPQFNINDFRHDFSRYLSILNRALGEHKSLPPKERRLRQEIVTAALNGKIRFDPNRDPKPAHWEKDNDGNYVLRPGHVAAGLEDRVYNNGAPTGCKMASKSLFLEGISKLAESEGQGERFDREYSGKPLNDILPDQQSNDLHKFTDHPGDLSAPQFVPGDRLWMKNHRYDPKEDPEGHEGSNVIYIGKDNDGNPLFIHTTLDPNESESDVVTYKDLRNQVRGYSAEGRQDKPENYRFEERYKPRVPEWMKKGN